MGVQRLEIHVLYRNQRGAGGGIAAAPDRGAHALPASRPVASCSKAVLLDKGLQHQDWMAVFILPIAADAPGNDAQIKVLAHAIAVTQVRVLLALWQNLWVNLDEIR